MTPETTRPAEKAKRWLRRHRLGLVWGCMPVAAAIGIAFGAAAGTPLEDILAKTAARPDAVAWNALYCLLLGAIEETIFCGWVLPALVRRIERPPRSAAGRRRRGRGASRGAHPLPHPARRCKAALASGALFGAVHVLTGLQLECGLPGVVLKCLQAALFGFCMAALRLESGSLARPILAHAAFDFVYLGIPNVLADAIPLEAASLPPESIVGVVASGLFLLVPAKLCLHMLAERGIMAADRTHTERKRADMIVNERDTREERALDAAKRMLTAARTAPKGKGADIIECAVAYGDDLEAIAAEMEAYSAETGYKFLLRDAENVRACQCVVLVGTRAKMQGLNCGHCGFATCAEKPAAVPCEINSVDVGIALGSAVATAADARVDTRIMFSAGMAAERLGLLGADVKQVYAIPVSIASKSPFFDRPPK